MKDENPPQKSSFAVELKRGRRSCSSAKFTVVPRSSWLVAVAGVAANDVAIDLAAIVADAIIVIVNAGAEAVATTS